MTIKAYTVTDEYGEGHAVVRFAHHNVVARRDGANELNLEFESVSCRRSPEFDGYADAGSVPPLALIDHGWWLECLQCGTRLSLDDEDEDGEPLPRDAMVERGDRVFCDATCLSAYDAKVNAQNETFRDFTKRVHELRPDLEWRQFHGEYPHITCYATFGFPGCKYGGSVRQDKGELSWSIATGDVEAWHAYEASRKAK